MSDEERRQKRHYLKFFVEDLFEYILNKNITLWRITRSDYLRQAHAEVPTEYKFNENVVRASIIALECYDDVCSREAKNVMNKIKNVVSSQKAHHLRTAVEEMSLKFNLNSPDSFMAFLTAVASTSIRVCEIGEQALVPTIILAVESCIYRAAMGDFDKVFKLINDSTAYFLNTYPV